MLKFHDAIDSFCEVPDKIGVYIPLTGCRIRCPECNSKWLWEFSGKELTTDVMDDILSHHKDAEVVILGGGHDYDMLETMFKHIKSKGLLTCWYTGHNKLQDWMPLKYLDYIKIGSYQGKPLNDPETNQRFYELRHAYDIDGRYKGFVKFNITYKFQSIKTDNEN